MTYDINNMNQILLGSDLYWPEYLLRRQRRKSSYVCKEQHTVHTGRKTGVAAGFNSWLKQPLNFHLCPVWNQRWVILDNYPF